MDKIKVNNQIVQMRKYVKQAKTRIINKCVKEIKLLENRKGDVNQIAKCKRKAKRLLSEVAILKKIKPDSVSKMALSKSKDWKAILNQKNIPLEERCFAMVANYEPLQTEIEKFISNNYYLVPKIASLLQEWEEKAKLSPGKIKNGNKNLRNKSNSASNYKIKNNIKESTKLFTQKTEANIISQSSEKNLNSECNPLQHKESEQNDLKISDSDFVLKSEKESEEDFYSENENIVNDDNSQKNLNSKTASKTDGITLKYIGTNLPSISEDELEKSFNKNILKDSHYKKIGTQKLDSNLKSQIYECNSFSNTKKEARFETALSPTHSTKAVALLNLNELLDLDEIPIGNTYSNTNFVPEVEKRKRDAFFLNDGEIESERNDSDNTSDDRKWNRNHSPPEKKISKNSPWTDASYLNQKQNGFHKKNKSTSDNFRNKKNSSHSEKLAVKKSKMTNKNFYYKDGANISGKHLKKHERIMKNKFNDREIKANIGPKTFKSKERYFEKTQNNSSNKDFSQKTKVDFFNNKAKVAEQEPLHPSWEAKKKLKESTAVKFQGKRIVFDD